MQGNRSYLFGLALDAVKNGLKGRVGEPALETRFLVIFEARAHTLGAKVEGIAKGLVDGL